MEPRLSPATRALLRAARTDGPSAAARAKVWSSVAGAVGTSAGAGAGASAGAGAGAGAGASAIAATKMLAIGTLLGGTITVGLAAMLLHVGTAPVVTPPLAPAAVTVRASAATPAATAAEPIPDPRAQPAPPPDLTATVPAVVPVVAPAGAVEAHSPALPTSSVRAQSPTLDDTLAREAVLVAEARGALVRGDPHSALRSIHAARLLPSHQLGPEELAVESQAFRALGRDEEAAEADAQLRRVFPESALAR